MFLVFCLMPQEISVCSGIKKSLIALFGLFSDGKRYRTIRMCFLDRTYDIADPVIGIIRILSALEDKSLKSDLLAYITTGQYLLFGEPVPVRLFIAVTYSAIVTIVLTIIRELDKAS